MDEIASLLAVVLGLGIFFVILATIGYIGLSLRKASEYSRRGVPGGFRHGLVGAIGLGVLLLIGYWIFAASADRIIPVIGGIIILVILVLGWNGKLIVPGGEIFSND